MLNIDLLFLRAQFVQVKHVRNLLNLALRTSQSDARAVISNMGCRKQEMTRLFRTHFHV